MDLRLEEWEALSQIGIEVSAFPISSSGTSLQLLNLLKSWWVTPKKAVKIQNLNPSQLDAHFFNSTYQPLFISERASSPSPRVRAYRRLPGSLLGQRIEEDRLHVPSTVHFEGVRRILRFKGLTLHSAPLSGA